MSTNKSKKKIVKKSQKEEKKLPSLRADTPAYAPVSKRKGRARNDKQVLTTLYSPTQNSEYQTALKVRVPFNFLAFQEMYAAFTSFALTHLLSNSDDPTDVTNIYDGIAYLFNSMVDEISGNVVLNERLQIFHDLIQGFLGKDVRRHGVATINYSWENPSFTATGTYSTAYNQWATVLNGVDDGSYLAPSSVVAPIPSVQAYSNFMRLIKGITTMRAKQLAPVAPDAPSVLSKDVSAFAKVYNYVGLNPSGSGGFYNDVESEVSITAPILCHNVAYNVNKEDDRVPEKLMANSGGPAFNLAPLLPLYDSWFNKVPIKVKYIDFFELVNTLIYWYAEAVTTEVESSDSTYADFQFTFDFQSFCVMLRQAVLANSKCQWITQFMGPLNYNDNLTNFTPFQILANCYGSDVFKRVYVPPLIAENMSMLLPQVSHPTKRKSKINKDYYLPCWGFYNDIQPEWFFNNPNTPTPIFKGAAVKTMSLVDCTVGSNTYINVNTAAYTAVMAEWNTKVTKLKALVNVATLDNLTPPQNSIFLQMTRVNGWIDRERAVQASTKLNFPCMAYIKNAPSLVRQSSVKDIDPKRSTVPKPQLPPPTNVVYISEVNRFSGFPVPKELHSLSEFLILPSVRLDPNSSNDILNQNMYQIIEGEYLQMPQNYNSLAPAYLDRQYAAALMAIEGKGKVTGSNVSIVLDALARRGDGGILSGLLGGVAKNIFPGASGVIDAISTVIPI